MCISLQTSVKIQVGTTVGAGPKQWDQIETVHVMKINEPFPTDDDDSENTPSM